MLDADRAVGIIPAELEPALTDPAVKLALWGDDHLEEVADALSRQRS